MKEASILQEDSTIQSDVCSLFNEYESRRVEITNARLENKDRTEFALHVIHRRLTTLKETLKDRGAHSNLGSLHEGIQITSHSGPFTVKFASGSLRITDGSSHESALVNMSNDNQTWTFSPTSITDVPYEHCPVTQMARKLVQQEIDRYLGVITNPEVDKDTPALRGDTKRFLGEVSTTLEHWRQTSTKAARALKTNQRSTERALHRIYTLLVAFRDLLEQHGLSHRIQLQKKGPFTVEFEGTFIKISDASTAEKARVKTSITTNHDSDTVITEYEPEALLVPYERCPILEPILSAFKREFGT